MIDTIVGDEWRWAVVCLGVAATVILAALWVARKHQHGMGFSESMSIIGGGLVCASVTVATLGVIFDWDSVWRIPFLVVALAYVVVGRGIELWQTRRRK